jgi:hypothetical protein
MQTPTQYPVINWNRAATKCSLSDHLEFFSLACTPHDENCTQAGQDLESQIKECTALINQFIRSAGQPDPGAEFFIIETTGHDFGIYYEAGIFYQPQTAEQEEADEDSGSEIYAMVIEQNIPDKWDPEALQELRTAGHPNYQPAKVVRMKAA